jgi:MoxR-like ATPase
VPTVASASVTPADVSAALSKHGYLPDEGLATAVFLALELQRPLLLEGEAGVGKTELAKVMARASGGELIRLQCYEGIDAAQAVYDWDYARQLLHLRAAEATGETVGRTSDSLEADLYQERFLVKRALLRAIAPTEGPPPVLLIDEIDRADDEFEAYLLEVLSDYQITIPELGVFKAERPPIVVLTSNRTRDVHDAVAAMRDLNLYKPPGVAETIDWASALGRLGVTALNEATVAHTLGTVLKYREDHQRVEQHGVGDLLQNAVKQALERTKV